ncbi:unnamed protein product [Amoebophrya sp. A25]|nr:unnamed protein product [Amoebophrya sp. A25]|eukprot:GSA25T00020010001.1
MMGPPSHQPPPIMVQQQQAFPTSQLQATDHAPSSWQYLQHDVGSCTSSQVVTRACSGNPAFGLGGYQHQDDQQQAMAYNPVGSQPAHQLQEQGQQVVVQSNMQASSAQAVEVQQPPSFAMRAEMARTNSSRSVAALPSQLQQQHQVQKPNFVAAASRANSSTVMTASPQVAAAKQGDSSAVSSSPPQAARANGAWKPPGSEQRNVEKASPSPSPASQRSALFSSKCLDDARKQKNGGARKNSNSSPSPEDTQSTTCETATRKASNDSTGSSSAAAHTVERGVSSASSSSATRPRAPSAGAGSSVALTRACFPKTARTLKASATPAALSSSAPGSKSSSGAMLVAETEASGGQGQKQTRDRVPLQRTACTASCPVKMILSSCRWSDVDEDVEEIQMAGTPSSTCLPPPLIRRQFGDKSQSFASSSSASFKGSYNWSSNKGLHDKSGLKKGEGGKKGGKEHECNKGQHDFKKGEGKKGKGKEQHEPNFKGEGKTNKKGAGKNYQLHAESSTSCNVNNIRGQHQASSASRRPSSCSSKGQTPEKGSSNKGKGKNQHSQTVKKNKNSSTLKRPRVLEATSSPSSPEDFFSQRDEFSYADPSAKRHRSTGVANSSPGVPGAPGSGNASYIRLLRHATKDERLNKLRVLLAGGPPPAYAGEVELVG